jgi:hypothetical protein
MTLAILSCLLIGKDFGPYDLVVIIKQGGDNEADTWIARDHVRRSLGVAADRSQCGVFGHVR